jgi:hypothetical protein
LISGQLAGDHVRSCGCTTSLPSDIVDIFDRSK